MNIIGIVILVCILFIPIGIIWSNIESKERENNIKILIDDLKKNGFPQLTEEEQINLLTHSNLNIIREKLKIQEVPYEILDYIINLDEEKLKKEIKTELHNSDIVEKHNFKHAKKQDGDWIITTKKNNDEIFELIHQERGNIYERKQFKDYDSLLDYLVISRLLIVPKYHKKYNAGGAKLISEFKKLD